MRTDGIKIGTNRKTIRSSLDKIPLCKFSNFFSIFDFESINNPMIPKKSIIKQKSFTGKIRRGSLLQEMLLWSILNEKSVGGKAMTRILIVGSLNMDTVLEVAHLPAPGETVLSRSKHLVPGGKGANAAFAAGRLGGDAALLGCVGRD